MLPTTSWRGADLERCGPLCSHEGSTFARPRAALRVAVLSREQRNENIPVHVLSHRLHDSVTGRDSRRFHNLTDCHSLKTSSQSFSFRLRLSQNFSHEITRRSQSTLNKCMKSFENQGEKQKGVQTELSQSGLRSSFGSRETVTCSGHGSGALFARTHLLPEERARKLKEKITEGKISGCQEANTPHQRALDTGYASRPHKCALVQCCADVQMICF